MAGSLTGAVALTTSHILRNLLVTGRIWLYAGTSGVSGGTNANFATVKIHPVRTISRKDSYFRESSTTTRQTPVIGEDIV